VLFAGIAVLVMISYVRIFIPLDYNKYSRDFSKKVSYIVPPDDKLMAYEYISNRSVHYFGRTIPKTNDISELYKHYQQGGWAIATATHMQELQQDSRFRRVYLKAKAERRRQHDAAGALFHKSAPIVKDDNRGL